MARSFPVPAYTTTGQINGANKRALSATSPGTTDSTSTKGASVTLLAPRRYYLKPEQAADAAGQAPNPVGTAFGAGWGFVPSANGVTPLATDGFSIDAGNYVVQVVHARDSGLTSADQTAMIFTAILFRANANATSFPQEIGRADSAAVTISTTKTTTPITISGAAATFAPGEILWLEVFVGSSTTTSATGSVAQFYTNSTTGIRITQAPPFVANYAKALSDPLNIADAVSRRTINARQLADAAGSADSLQRVASFPRALNDAVMPVGDAMGRLYLANRNLADGISEGDAITRRIITMRQLVDAMSISDAITRRATYARNPMDSLSAGGGNTTVVRRSTLVFED